MTADVDPTASVADQAYQAAGSPELPDGPQPQRVSSGSHFNPVQFADQLQTAMPGEIPAVHQNPTSWYGEGDN